MSHTYEFEEAIAVGHDLEGVAEDGQASGIRWGVTRPAHALADVQEHKHKEGTNSPHNEGHGARKYASYGRIMDSHLEMNIRSWRSFGLVEVQREHSRLVLC